MRFILNQPLRFHTTLCFFEIEAYFPPFTMPENDNCRDAFGSLVPPELMDEIPNEIMESHRLGVPWPPIAWNRIKLSANGSGSSQ